MMTNSLFSYKMRVLLISCGAFNMEGVNDFIQHSYNKHVNPQNKETDIDKMNRHLYQRIILKISMRGKYNEYNNLLSVKSEK